MKRKVSVTIDQKIYQKAHSLGVNVSKVSENALQAIIDAIESRNPAKQPVSVDAFPEKRVKWTGRDLNPRPPDCEAKTYGSGDFLDFEHFEEWLNKDGKHKPYVARYMVSYAREFQHCLQDKDLSALLELAPGKKRLVMASLSALSKFLGIYEDFKGLIKQYSLTWGGQSKDDIIIDRLTSVKDPEEIWHWILDVKRLRPELTDFMNLMADSGLRFVEAVNSYNQIIRLGESEGLELVLANNGKTRLKGYFNVEKSTLEHFWFKELFLRKTKKAFVSFVPHDLVERIAENEPVHLSGVQTSVKRCLPLRFGDVREAQGTFMTRFLKREEIDFLHGRMTSDVFMANYFNPALIADLRTRVFQGIAEIQEKVKV